MGFARRDQGRRRKTMLGHLRRRPTGSLRPNCRDRPQPPSALRVATGQSRLLCRASSTMARHGVRQSLREFDPSRSPQTLPYLRSSVLSPHFSPLVYCVAANIRPGCVTLCRPPRRTARVRLRGPRSQALPGRLLRRLATTSDEKSGLVQDDAPDR